MTDRLPRDAEPDERGWFATATTTHCVSPDLLFAMRAGTLPADIAARIESHTAECAACRALAAALTAMDAGPTAEEEQRIRRSISDRRPSRIIIWARPAWLAAAATVIGAIGLALLLGRSDGVRPPVEPAAHDRVLPAQTFALALEKPAVDLPADVLVLRGARPRPYAAALVEALTLYRQDRFADAASRFEDVTRRYPDRPHGQFYLGVSLLLADRAADAVGPLDRARALAAADPELRDSATWYLAVAFERSGETASAVQALADLCAGGATRREDACRGLATLRQPVGSGARNRETPSVGGPGVSGGNPSARRPAGAGPGVPVH